MKIKWLNIGLILTSLLGYLEWGGGNSIFLVQAEWEIVLKLFTDPMSVIHPFVLLPLIGQLLLVLTLFQNRPGKRLTYWGMAGIGILLVLMFFIGLIGINLKVVLSTLPFLLLSIYTLKVIHKKGVKD